MSSFNHSGTARPSRLATAIKSALAIAAVASVSAPSLAGAKLEINDDSWVSVGAGIRFAATFVEDGSPDGEDTSSDFDIQNLRLYVNGQITDKIGFTFNTDEIFGNGPTDVLDAFMRFEFNEHFNIHAGRHLVPADRIEMNGPFYALSWNQYTQPLFASDQVDVAGTYGRDDGVTVWGKAGQFQYAVGLFEGLAGNDTANQSDSPLVAARFAYNFLSMENNPAYYTSSTYYGGLGNVFTLGLSFQSQSDGVGTAANPGDFSGYAVDLLSETVLDGGGVVTFEAEYKEFDSDYIGGAPDDATDFGLFDGDSYFATAAYLIPGDGYGKFQPYVRFVENNPTDLPSSDLTEVGLNYVIKGHNARLNLNYATGDANISGYRGTDTDSISFGVQLQI